MIIPVALSLFLNLQAVALDSRPLGPTDSNGDCIWPYVPGWYGSDVKIYAGIGNLVYTKGFGTQVGPDDIPSLQSTSLWGSPSVCNGTAPAAEYSDSTILAVTGYLSSMPTADEYSRQVIQRKLRAGNPAVDRSSRSPSGKAYSGVERRSRSLGSTTSGSVISESHLINRRTYYVVQKWNTLLPTTEELKADRLRYLGEDSWASRAVNEGLSAPPEVVEALNFTGDALPDNVDRAMRLFPRETFERLFPRRDAVFSYENLLRSIATFPVFCRSVPADLAAAGDESDDLCKKSLAILLSIQDHQLTQPISPSCDTMQPQDLTPPFIYIYPPSSSQNYCARGLLGLSGSEEYGHFSETIFQNSQFLIDNADLVGTTWLAFASGIWALVTARKSLPSPLWVLDSSVYHNGRSTNQDERFSETYSLIKNSCDGVDDAIERYLTLKQMLQVETGRDDPSSDDCLPVSDLNFTTVKTYWRKYIEDKTLEKSSIPSHLSRKETAHETPLYVHRCQLTSERSPFEITSLIGYSECVKWYFQSVLVNPANVIIYRNGNSVH